MLNLHEAQQILEPEQNDDEFEDQEEEEQDKVEDLPDDRILNSENI